jgi:hypothetical protein
VNKEGVLGHRVSDLRRRRSPQGPPYRRPRVRRLLLVILGAAAFLLPAGASGRPELPSVGTVTPIIYGTQGANGWYVTNVTVNWVIQPLGYLTSEGCNARTIATDTVNTDLTCTAWWSDGSASSTVHIHRDATAPTVTAVPARPPDASDWYNHPLTVGFAGSDAISGIESCSQATYAGPDNPNASLSGSCRDRAGHQTAAVAGFKYDATPPVINRLAIRAGKRSAKVNWRTTAGAEGVQLLRSPGFKGAAESVLYTGRETNHVDRGLTPGRNYHYRLVASDQAANQAEKATDFVARGALLYPAPGERVSRPPLLIWTAKRGASYYNVILSRRGRRVFSAWPLRSRLRVPRAWTYNGRRYKLRPGTYSWYVWPGRGPLSAGKYGKMLGGSTFTFGGSG